MDFSARWAREPRYKLVCHRISFFERLAISSKEGLDLARELWMNNKKGHPYRCPFLFTLEWFTFWSG